MNFHGERETGSYRTWDDTLQRPQEAGWVSPICSIDSSHQQLCERVGKI